MTWVTSGYWILPLPFKLKVYIPLPRWRCAVLPTRYRCVHSKSIKGPPSVRRACLIAATYRTLDRAAATLPGLYTTNPTVLPSDSSIVADGAETERFPRAPNWESEEDFRRAFRNSVEYKN
ncbi:jg2661 [Pararge aegeria aegeria]|uniref:Jg2661 protein n=1 Tax=Pararge aegeria aegeria TaxID=348720 RepID=A0A8S4QKK9_9NEOP|nr:jg2661 [Pararge aegeria aegeria]